jgi:hypothetical protein
MKARKEVYACPNITPKAYETDSLRHIDNDFVEALRVEAGGREAVGEMRIERETEAPLSTNAVARHQAQLWEAWSREPEPFAA